MIARVAFIVLLVTTALGLRHAAEARAAPRPGPAACAAAFDRGGPAHSWPHPAGKCRPSFGASGPAQGRDCGRRTPRKCSRSANMEHPQALASAKKSGPVVPVRTQNRLCARWCGLGSASQPQRCSTACLDADVKLGTSTNRPRPTPRATMPGRCSARPTGSDPAHFAALETKALQLTGGPRPARRRPSGARTFTERWWPTAKPTSFSPIATNCA